MVKLSLQDQLLKAGLANKKQAVKAKKAKNNKEKLKRSGADVTDEVEIRAREAEEQRVARDRELNLEKTALAEKKAIDAQIRQIVSMNRIEDRGDIEFRFMENDVVKTLMIQEVQRMALVSGALAIVKVDDKFDLVPRAVAAKIAVRDDSLILLSNEQSEEDQVDDEYADFKVPDDLMW